MTDAELEQLQLDVNGEVARRAVTKDLGDKFAEIIKAAEVAGVTVEVIDEAVKNGKDKAHDPAHGRDPDWIPPRVDKEPRKLAKSQKEKQDELRAMADKAYDEAVKAIGDGDDNGRG
jgi:hypothetical protein